MGLLEERGYKRDSGSPENSHFLGCEGDPFWPYQKGVPPLGKKPSRN